MPCSILEILCPCFPTKPVPSSFTANVVKTLESLLLEHKGRTNQAAYELDFLESNNRTGSSIRSRMGALGAEFKELEEMEQSMKKFAVKGGLDLVGGMSSIQRIEEAVARRKGVQREWRRLARDAGVNIKG